MNGATPRHSARSTSSILKHRTRSGAITPKHKLGKRCASTLALGPIAVWPVHSIPVGRRAMPLFLKPLIGFTTSTSLLTSLMVLVSHVG